MDVSSSTNNNDTLEDDAWKDSFDKLLDPRPVLRQLNVIKRDVRASFNMNSSVENNSINISKEVKHDCSPLVNFRRLGAGNRNVNIRCASISTPMGKQVISNHFNCSLSPITTWKLNFCDQSDVPSNIVKGNKDVDEPAKRKKSVKIVENRQPTKPRRKTTLQTKFLDVLDEHEQKRPKSMSTRYVDRVSRVKRRSILTVASSMVVNDNDAKRSRESRNNPKIIIVDYDDACDNQRNKDTDLTQPVLETEPVKRKKSVKIIENKPDKQQRRKTSLKTKFIDVLDEHEQKRPKSMPTRYMERVSAVERQTILAVQLEASSKDVNRNIDKRALDTPTNPKIVIVDYDDACDKQHNTETDLTEPIVIEQPAKRKKSVKIIENKPITQQRRKISLRTKFLDVLDEHEQKRSKSMPTRYIDRVNSVKRQTILTAQICDNIEASSKEDDENDDNRNRDIRTDPKIIIVDHDDTSVKQHNKESDVPQQEAINEPAKRKKSVKISENNPATRRRTFDEDVHPEHNEKRPKSMLTSNKPKSLGACQRQTMITLQPGKWRKSLYVWRHTNNIKTPHLETNGTFSDDKSFVNQSIGCRKSVFLRTEPTTVGKSVVGASSVWEERVLQRCQQISALEFIQTYTAADMQSCKKIGEGAYGEVFMNTFPNASFDTVLKIIPIEGRELVNGETQKTYEQILPEIVISLELSNLDDASRTTNVTCGFVGIRKIACVRGEYPAHLMKLWDEYDAEKGSENDHPNIFSSEQLYIVLELAYGGRDLEAFVFINAEQSFYALQQVIFTLAVGEDAFQFEHRDLHWGNILVNATTQKFVTYKLQGKSFVMPTIGVKTTIIDYTLSRMTFDDCCFYNDLSNDEELFDATGDYQFDIYRLMRDVLKNNWNKFEPKTNVFWISYLIRKLLNGVTYKNTRSKVHSTYINKLKQLDKSILNQNSSIDCAHLLMK